LADIFISSSRLDADRVRPIAERLSSLGYSVWWERPERTGQAALDETAAQLDDAKAVLTIWSANARNSSLVCAESALAFDAHKLLQLRIDAAAAPAPFNAHAIADMRGSGEWGVLEDKLARLVRDGALTEDADARAPIPTPTLGAIPKALTFALVTTLLAFAITVGATLNGTMTSTQLQIASTGALTIGFICAAVSGFRLLIVLRAGG